MMDQVDVLLWDCDGVLQHGRFDWRQHIDRTVRPGFSTKLFEAEQPALRGERSLRAVLEELLVKDERQFGDPGVTVDDLLDIWDQFDLDPDAMAVLAAVRELGVPCLLATNQQDHRVRLMRRVRGYDDLVDGSYYSSEIGAMKPDLRFFKHVVADLDMDPGRIGFIDDLHSNVDAARQVGIRAVRHDPESGAPGIIDALDELLPNLAHRMAALRAE